MSKSHHYNNRDSFHNHVVDVVEESDQSVPLLLNFHVFELFVVKNSSYQCHRDDAAGCLFFLEELKPLPSPMTPVLLLLQ